ncbi:hypothetical protein G6F22_019390 [Rhizopus arrhizus]|nr:hypothetical protein G6F22_019390 [Rhizopus arrhizus]
MHRPGCRGLSDLRLRERLRAPAVRPGAEQELCADRCRPHLYRRAAELQHRLGHHRHAGAARRRVEGDRPSGLHGYRNPGCVELLQRRVRRRSPRGGRCAQSGLGG